MLPLAGATAATAAAVTMLVLPVGAKPGRRARGSRRRLRGAGLSRRCRSRCDRRRGSSPQARGRVAVFGDSVAWTMMRYLPPTPGLSFTNYTTIGCGIARGGPYRYAGETLNQKPECDAWPSRWSQRINHDRPDVVLLIIGRWEIVDRVNEGHWTHIGDDGVRRVSARRAATGARHSRPRPGARVVVTTEPYNRRGEQPDGSLYPEDQPDPRRCAGTPCCAASSGQRPDVTVLDLNKKLCPNGYYTNKVDGIKMRMRRGASHAGGGEVVDAVADRRAALIACRTRALPGSESPVAERPRPRRSSSIARSLPSGPSSL